MAADEAPTPSELIQQWRDQARRIREDRPQVSQAIAACADEMEAALRPRVLSDVEVAHLTEGLEMQSGVLTNRPTPWTPNRTS